MIAISLRQSPYNDGIFRHVGFWLNILIHKDTTASPQFSPFNVFYPNVYICGAT